MSDIPGHTSLPYSEDSREDSLFHYTSADGLIGILQSGEIWSTAYYCSNDESELTAGKGILTPEFLRATNKMIQENDPMVETFLKRGVDVQNHARNFEQTIISHTFHTLCAYITCFCMPNGEEDFLHGLLSQWRAYGVDGGYALQFSRKKLLAEIEKANKALELNYELQDVYYTAENPLKSKVLSHSDSFVRAYREHMKELSAPLGELLNKQSIPSPIAGLFDGPLESLLDYLIQTKSHHFSEEKECRLSLVTGISPEAQILPTYFFNRDGLTIPYKKSQRATFPLLDCIEWIIIGPNPRMRTRFQSVTQMIRGTGLAIKVRPSHIPFSRP